MICTMLTALALLGLVAPAQASVYAVQQKDGSWKVSRYDDGDPTVSVTYRDQGGAEPLIYFSARAEYPGGLWLIGTTVKMTNNAWRSYQHDLAGR